MPSSGSTKPYTELVDSFPRLGRRAMTPRRRLAAFLLAGAVAGAFGDAAAQSTPETLRARAQGQAADPANAEMESGDGSEEVRPADGSARRARHRLWTRAGAQARRLRPGAGEERADPADGPRRGLDVRRQGQCRRGREQGAVLAAARLHRRRVELPDGPAASPLEQTEDVGRALAFVQANARSWGGDGARVVLMGHSSGAHLVALLTAAPAVVPGPAPGRGSGRSRSTAPRSTWSSS